MDATQTMCELLTQKKVLFLAYEENTEPLTQCAPEDIEHYITKRTELAIQIDEVNKKIIKFCESVPQGGSMQDAAANRCDYGALPVPLQPVFALGQEVLGAMNRVAGHEPAIASRLQSLLTEYRAAIASTQNAPKIARYLSGMIGTDSINLLDGRDKV